MGKEDAPQFYHRLTANGIETMNDIPVYTFECKVCCAGLNPTAYREVLEALTHCISQLGDFVREGKASEEDREAYQEAKQALAHAQETP